jgi:hypothetical protein
VGRVRGPDMNVRVDEVHVGFSSHRCPQSEPDAQRGRSGEIASLRFGIGLSSPGGRYHYKLPSAFMQIQKGLANQSQVL